MNKLDELKTKFFFTQEDKRRVAQARIDEVLTIIFQEIPELRFIRIRGFTPSFMDGDPCVHTTEVAVDCYDPHCVFDEYLGAKEDKSKILLKDRNLRYLNGTTFIIDKVWNSYVRRYEEIDLPEYGKDIIKAQEILETLENDFFSVYDTNWQLDIIRDGDATNGYRVEKEGFVCGF